MQKEPMQLLTLAEAAELLRLDQHKVQRLARRGKLAGSIVLPSGEVRFDKARLLAWLETLAKGEARP